MLLITWDAHKTTLLCKHYQERTLPDTLLESQLVRTNTARRRLGCGHNSCLNARRPARGQIGDGLGGEGDGGGLDGGGLDGVDLTVVDLTVVDLTVVDLTVLGS